MKHIKRILLLLNILIVPQIIVAQYRFTASLSQSGNCSGLYNGGIELAAIKSMVNHYNSTNYNSMNECESARARANAQAVTIGSCHLRITTSPCSGPGGNSGDLNFSQGQTEGNNNINILGPSHGRSFFSPNFANEIKYWSEEDIKKSILNNEFQIPQYQSLETNDPDYDNERAKIKENGFIIDTDKPFRSLNIDEKGGINTHSSDFITPKTIPANEKLVMTYLSQVNRETAPSIIDSEQYINWVKEQFNKILKCDDCIEKIIHKISRTKEESEILRNYREFEKHLLDEAINNIDNKISKTVETNEKKEIDMAILAFDCYNKESIDWNENNSIDYLYNTNYRRIDLNNRSNIPQTIQGLANLIKDYNDTEKETGFNAVLYYNNKTNEYTIAFEGSTDIWNDWGKNNLKQAIGLIGEQFRFANSIGEYVKQTNILNDVKINFTGHSLGGALASVAGLNSGRPTYTYNAEGVSDKILEEFGLLEKKRNNEFEITAYHTDNDILTITQNSSQNLSKITVDPEDDKNNYISNAIGTEINIGNINQPSPINSKAVKYTAITPGMKLILLIENCKAHKMEPIVKYFINKNKSTQEYWQQLTDSQNNMNREIGNTRMRSYEQIYITTNE